MALVFETLLDLVNDETENDPGWLWGEIIQRKSLVVVHTGPKRGKSMWTQNLAVALACGWESFLDIPIPEAARGSRTVIFQKEVNRYSMKHRTLQMVKNGDLPKEALERIVHNKSRAVMISHPSVFEAFHGYIKKVQPDLVIFDPLSGVLTDDENDNAAVGRSLALLLAIREDPGCAMIVVHHDRKGSEATRHASPEQSARGADRIIADSDGVLSLKRHGKNILGPQSQFNHLSRNSAGVAPFVAVFNKETFWWERVYEKGDSSLVLSLLDGRQMTRAALRTKIEGLWGLHDPTHHRAAQRYIDAAIEAKMLVAQGTGKDCVYAAVEEGKK